MKLAIKIGVSFISRDKENPAVWARLGAVGVGSHSCLPLASALSCCWLPRVDSGSCRPSIYMQQHLWQHYAVELPAMMEMFCVCAAQHGSHQPCTAAEHLKCDSCNCGTEAFTFINRHLSNHTWPMATILLSTDRKQWRSVVSQNSQQMS